MNIISKINQLPVIAPQPRRLTDRRTHDRRRRTREPIRAAGERDTDRRSGRERRATARVEVELDFEELIGDTRYFRLTRDLSVFGLSTRCGYPHPIGTRLDLRLYLPDAPSTPVALAAEVVGYDTFDGGMRLAFRSPPKEAIRRIHRFLSTLPTA